MMKRGLYRLLPFCLVLFVLAGIAAAQQPQLGQPPILPEQSTELQIAAPELEPAAYLPLVHKPPKKPPWIDTGNRAAAKHAYYQEYAIGSVLIEWTGNHDNCIPGQTSAVYKDTVLKRINYFRRMAGVPPIVGFTAEYNRKAQAAALMLSVNGKLSHYPDSAWECYSEDGREAAGHSNIQLGANGPAGISFYILDGGDNNYAVGHRRWILYPQTQYMGTGDIPGTDGKCSANALWVINSNIWGLRPETRYGFVAWPSQGYVPYTLAFPRWSFSYPDADFHSATVSMAKNGQEVGLTVNPVEDGYGENTIVWEPSVYTQERPSQDTIFTITIDNVIINGASRSFEYEVILFDPSTE